LILFCLVTEGNENVEGIDGSSHTEGSVQDEGGDVVDIGSDNVGDNVGYFDHCKLFYFFCNCN